MSVEALSWALNQAPVEDPGAAAVLIGLANHAGPDGRECWPSVERLAYYGRMSERTVRRHLRTLEDTGVIARDEDTRGRDAKTRADQRPNAYRLVMDGPTRESFETRRDRVRAERKQSDGGSVCHPVEGIADEAATGGQSDRPDKMTGGTNATARGVNLTPEPSVEPSPTPTPTELGGTHEADAQLPLVAAPAQPARKRGTGGTPHELPEDWAPSPELRAETVAKAPWLDVDREVERFRNHFRGTGKKWKRWDLAWRNWVDKCQPPRNGQGGRPGPYRDTGWQDGSSAASWDRLNETGGIDR